MRVTPNRILRTVAAASFFYFILKFFPGLPFFDFSPSGFRGGINSVIGTLTNSVPGAWFFPPKIWLKQLDKLSDMDFRHLEHYCEGPKLPVDYLVFQSSVALVGSFLVKDQVFHFISPVLKVLFPPETRNDKEILLATQVLVRHGDRGSLFTVKDESHVGCPYEDTYSLPETFLAYHEAAQAYKDPKTTDKFDFVPKKSGCLNGELTSKGVIQHLELGSAVRRRLGQAAENWDLNKAAVYSTYYSRTYQSAMAFMHGIAPSFKSLSRNIHIAPAGDHMFCSMADTCDCSTSRHITSEYYRLKRELFEKDRETVALMERIRTVLASHLERPLTNWPVHIFDVLLQFACHGKRIPCFGGTCISYHDIVQVITLLESLAVQLTDLPAIKRFSVLDSYGLLQAIVDKFGAIINGSMTAPKDRFTLFSAHDATVVPVMHSLGLPFRIVIPYASFVMFELFSTDAATPDQVYIRVIYNGEDVTSKTIPGLQLDSATSPLPFRIFKDFIDKNLKADYYSTCTTPA